MQTNVLFTPVGHSVRGEVLDAVSEVIVQARGPAARASVIAELVQEMCAAVEWRHEAGAGPDDGRIDEATSVMLLSRAAQDHRRRMIAGSIRV